MERISVCILAYNDAHVIGDAISSVMWADEIVVIDTGSTDGTVALAESMGARVVAVKFSGFGDLRNRAAEECKMNWVFSLDSDERCTPSARDEIMRLMAGGVSHDVFFVPRRNFVMGRWMKGAGYYPDFRGPQLFRKGTLRYTSAPIHEGFELLTARKPGTLANAIWHIPFRDLEEILAKANLFSTLGAKKLSDRRVSMWSALGHGLWAFIRIYLFKRGFLDGWAGFVVALANFEGTFYRYAKRYEAEQNWAAPRQPPLHRDGN